MSLDDLLKGLSAFKQGMTEVAIGQGIQDAQQQVAQLNDDLQKEVIDEQTRQQQANVIADNLALQLTQAGASPGQIQATAGRLGVGAPQMEEQRFRAAEAQKQRDFAKTMAGIKAGAKTRETRDFTSTIEADIQKMNEGIIQGETLLGRFEQAVADSPLGLPVSGPGIPTGKVREFFSPESFAIFNQQSKQYFNEYRKRITGVAAGEKEIKLLEDSIPTTSDPERLFKAKIKAMVQNEKIARARKLLKLQKRGFNVQGHEEELALAKNPLASPEDFAGGSAEPQTLTESIAPRKNPFKHKLGR